jgi:hypothetical protein
MPILTSPAFGPRTALIYVTTGAILDVWTVVWYLTRDHSLTRTEWFWVAGFFLTGLTLIVLGCLLGPLGQAARRSELPPSETIPAEAGIQQAAAANPPPVVTPAATVAAAPPATPVSAATPVPAAPITMPPPQPAIRR